MSEATMISQLPSTDDLDLVGQLHNLTIALTENEHHVATILAFDPDAHMSAGQLEAGTSDPRTCLLAGDAMGRLEWAMLARACYPEAGRLDETACLAHFLAERSRPAEAVLEPEIGARVRIRARQRIGGDRYAGREGVIVKTHFAGFYVKLDITPRERSQKTELVEAAYLDVLASDSAV